jgi:cobalt-zinc-cadmium efflux system outer membrane protein
MKTLLGLMIVLAAAGAAAADVTLDEALATTLASHPDLEAAAARTEAAQAEAEQAGAWPNPSVFLRVEDAPRDGDAWEGANRIVGFSQRIPWSGRIGAERAAAAAVATRTGFEAENAAAELRAQVRTVFAEALHAREALALCRQAVETAERLQAAAQARADAGDGSTADLRRARVDALGARAESYAARSRYAATLGELSALLGTDVDDVAGTLATPTRTYRLEELLAGLDRVPALQAARSGAEASTAHVSAASRRRLPELELETGLRTAPGVESFDAGVALSLPLFDRGGARLRAARAEETAAAARTRSIRRSLESRVRTLYAEYVAATDVLELYDQGIVPDADGMLASIEAAYDAGEASLGEVLQVRGEWIRAGLARLDAALAAVRIDAELSERFGD